MKPSLFVIAAACVIGLAGCAQVTSTPEPTRKSFDELVPEITEAPAQSRAGISLTVVGTLPPDETDRAISGVVTPTPDLPEPTPAGVADISKRLESLRTAKAFAADLAIDVRGDVQTLNGPPDRTARLVELSLLSQGERRRFLVKGTLTEQLGAPNGLDYVYIGNDAFVRGPSEVLSLVDDTWYVIPESRRDAVKPSFDPVDVVLSILGNAAIDRQVKPIGKKLFDDQECDAYRAGADEVIALQADNSLIGAFDNIDAAAIEALVCADNYLHLLTLEISGKTSVDATQPSTLQIRLHFYDFDRAFGIEAPADAQPFPEAAQASTAAPASQDNTAVLTNTWPTVGNARDLVVIPGGSAQINYSTDANIADIYAFYVAEFGALGYAESKDSTTQDSATLELLMEGGPDGTLILVQATVLEPGRVNVNIRRERGSLT
jgi:hypothetical protein